MPNGGTGASPAAGPSEVGGLVEHLFRSQAGRMVSHLARLLGPEHLDLAEEVVQESLLRALQLWPHSGVPRNPGGWLFQVARNAALDSVRRQQLFGEKTGEIVADLTRRPAVDADEVNFEQQLRDEELRMILLCCHPALPHEARVALSLKTVGGFGVGEIARAFLADEEAIAQRLVRAKRRMRELRLSLELPEAPELGQRLDSVLKVIYLMFNEGYAAHSGEDLIRLDVCREALRLGQLIAASPLSAPRVHALMALMAFQGARLPARVDGCGDLILLEDQDRRRWDPRLIALGFHHFGECAAGQEISEYHFQAAIAATHARAAQAEATDWPAILALYDQLIEMNPSPVVALNRAVAVFKVYGAREALASLDPFVRDPSLRRYHLLPAVRGQLLAATGDRDAALECFRQALSLPCSQPERRFLERKLAECEKPPVP